MPGLIVLPKRTPGHQTLLPLSPRLRGERWREGFNEILNLLNQGENTSAVGRIEVG